MICRPNRHVSSCCLQTWNEAVIVSRGLQFLSRPYKNTHVSFLGSSAFFKFSSLYHTSHLPYFSPPNSSWKKQLFSFARLHEARSAYLLAVHFTIPFPSCTYFSAIYHFEAEMRAFFGHLKIFRNGLFFQFCITIHIIRWACDIRCGIRGFLALLNLNLSLGKARFLRHRSGRGLLLRFWQRGGPKLSLTELYGCICYH
jgi:hypothetical protein